MKSNTRMSVVIPAFNEEKYIQKTLESLSKQSYPREAYEIIVVDNNSKDQTTRFAQDAGAKVVTETKQGYLYALSTGMQEATGEIIAITDADTVVAKDWLSQIDRVFLDQSIVGATGSITLSDQETFFQKVVSCLYEIFLQFNFLIGKPHLVGFNFAVLNSAFLKIGGLDMNFIMSPDVDLGLRLKKIGKVIYHRDMKVKTSTRRWEENSLRTFYQYAKSYFFTVWLRRPTGVKQEVIR